MFTSFGEQSERGVKITTIPPTRGGYENVCEGEQLKREIREEQYPHKRRG